MKDWQIRYDILFNSGAFDHEWYARRYDDVAATGLSPLEHYAKYGYRLGRHINGKMQQPDLRLREEYYDNDTILVSIICITYNHEKFISQALESILKQKTNFKFEVLVGNDKSTDNTGNIIKKYAEKYDSIRYCDRVKNLGANNNFMDLAKLVKGKFVAICEGDDYWTDENKLQIQVDFLTKNPEYTICFHPVEILREKDPSIYEIYPKIIPNKLDINTLLTSNFIQTNSVMYKWRFNNKNPLLFDENIAPGDWYIHLLHAEVGRIGFVDKIMGVYRKHQGGMWASHSNVVSRFKELSYNEMSFYKLLDKKYSNIVGNRFVDAQYYIFSTLAKYYLYECDFPSLFNFIQKNSTLAEIFMNKMGFEIKKTCLSHDELKIEIKSQTKFSVIVTSYNHGHYIRKCLDSILMQEGFFDIEIIIGDDCSTDDTPNIIHEYIKKFPNKISQISREKNVGMLRNMNECIKNCTGNYIAFCEADDYWISDRYLFKKLDIMHADKNIGMCFNWLLLNIEENSTFLPHNEQGNTPQGFVEFSTLMDKPLTANFSCCVYRRDALLSIPQEYYENSSAADWLLNLYVAKDWKIYFTREILSVYTIHPKGQWSGLSDEERSSKIEQYKIKHRYIFDLNKSKNNKHIIHVEKSDIEDYGFFGYLDEPVNEAIVDNEKIYITGWLLAQDYSNVWLSIVNKSDVQLIERLILRKDVTNAFYGDGIADELSMCGFKFCVNVDNFDKISVYVNSHNYRIHWIDIKKTDIEI